MIFKVVIIGLIITFILIFRKKEIFYVNPKVYFFSYINGNEYKLFYFFIKYYLNLGINPKNMLIVININKLNDSSKNIIKILKKYGISYKISKIYSSNIKRNYVNNFLNLVPINSWFIYPDLDEFFDYENNNIYMFIDKLEKNKYEGAISEFNNRITSNNELKDIDLNINIFKQFPKIVIDKNKALTKGLNYDTTKIIIFKKKKNNIKYTSSHSIDNELKFDKKIYKNNHFKFTKYTIDNIEQKLNNYLILDEPSENKEYKIKFYSNQLKLFYKKKGKYYLKQLPIRT